MLSQLVYVSQRSGSCTPDEVDKLLVWCQKNNPLLGITGVLLYSEHKFIQLLEGENKIINDLYENIRRDGRHNSVMLIYHSPIERRSFPSWHMGVRTMTEDDVDFKTAITKDDKVIFDKLLSGQEVDGKKVLNLINKFF